MEKNNTLKLISTGSKENRLKLFPEIEPFQTGRLKVSELHEIYFEISGNPNGKPAIVLHGGPGAGSSIK
jgi:proline iminopeptidase